MRPPRICFIGGIYHVVVRCNNREFFFRDEEDFRIFLKILHRAKQLYRVRVYAYCLTNNHVHLLVATEEKPNLSKFMQYVNGQFAMAYNLRHGKSGRFWGGRFYSTVVEETQFFNTLFYIEFNMVRCRAVEDADDWRWSSYRAHACGEENSVLYLHELYLALGASAEEREQVYRKMAATYLQEKGFARQSALTCGVIVGSKNFVESLLAKYGTIFAYFRNRLAFEFEVDLFSLRRLVPDPGG